MSLFLSVLINRFYCIHFNAIVLSNTASVGVLKSFLCVVTNQSLYLSLFAWNSIFYMSISIATPYCWAELLSILLLSRIKGTTDWTTYVLLKVLRPICMKHTAWGESRVINIAKVKAKCYICHETLIKTCILSYK